ncbi:protein translocase subunit secE/sec61 gamma [Nitrosomonas eutropha]|uniref:preprotein translocase subunit SecE n=1 Tax=Nitrosomonas TaxID=914 RepID=UPI00089B9081|nr:preprotein translocase subunit SecE [Nitrosomonas eutropha]MXS79203.1 preprotein translocase subunit SecE [Nitrosomonas sp. GH22]SDX09614.1 protein translocase subunit secE/sec61 gamma [Nitrosomonas eutropha]
MNKIKLGIAALLGAAGFFSFYFLQDSPVVIRVVALLLGLIFATIVILFTIQGKQLFSFFKDSIEEVKKVVWPTKKETLQTSGVVCAFVITMAFFLWIVDSGLMVIVKYVMDQEG